MRQPIATATIGGTTELERLIARSRLLGADPTLVVHGGGNTSTKLTERDHLGDERRVLRIKATGADLATIDQSGFTGLYLDQLLPLRDRSEMTDDELVAYLARCMVDPAERRPSIETLLHAFLPAAHVDHVHADAICALTNNPQGERVIAEVLGDDIAIVPYIRPGFELSRLVGDHADARAVVLRHHGLVTWGETHEESYGLTLELVERAQGYLDARRKPATYASRPGVQGDELEAFLAGLRGRLSQDRHAVLHVDRDQRELADRKDVVTVATAARSTPDHLLRIGHETAVIVPGELRSAEEPLPRVALVPGLGCVAAGTDARLAKTNAEVAARSHAVTAEVLDVFGEVEWLTDAQIEDFEQWPLELYKLSLAPPPRELEGRVVLVTGAASGIGREVARDLCARGAHLVLSDLDEPTMTVTAAEFPIERTASVIGDMTNPADVDRFVRTAVERFGGVDGVVSNVGAAVTGRLADLSLDDWRHSLAVNATAHFLLTRRVWPILEAQALGGSLVYVASKNAFGPGAGFGAYSAAKAAEVQIARVAALEGGAIGVRANVVNPDGVFEGSRLWSDEMRRERAAEHGVDPSELEQFYANRNLLKHHVSVRDVAEAVAFLVSDRSRATTGGVIPVDGGVPAAFPR